MTRLLFRQFTIYMGLFVLVIPAAAENDADPQTQPLSAYQQALHHFKQKQYDSTINILDSESNKDPYNFQINVLLTKAMLEKCAAMKAQGNNGYKYLIKRPYVIGMRLYKANPTRPEPYYIVAKSLLINNRPLKARKIIRKAIYFSSTAHDDYPDFLVVLGDAWVGSIGDDGRAKKEAKTAYQTALELRSDDADFQIMVQTRLQALEAKK